MSKLLFGKIESTAKVLCQLFFFLNIKEINNYTDFDLYKQTCIVFVNKQVKVIVAAICPSLMDCNNAFSLNNNISI